MLSAFEDANAAGKAPRSLLTSGCSLARPRLFFKMGAISVNGRGQLSDLHYMFEESTRNAYTAQLGAPTITLLAEPGPGKNKSLGLVTLISCASRTAVAQLLPSALRTRCHHCCLGHQGTFFFFLKEKLAPLQDLKHSTLCSKYSTGYFKKPHLVVAPTALPREDSVVPNVRRECRQPNKQRA